MSTNSQAIDKSYSVCCPSCHTWERPKKGIIVDAATKKRYGVFAPDESRDLREKFATLAIFQGFHNLFLRMPYRVIALFGGDFFKAGYVQAKKEWLIERQAWSVEGDLTKPLAGRISLISKTTRKSLFQLAKNVGKIATMPLAVTALEFVALYGLLNPLDARVFYADIENAWVRDNSCYSNHEKMRISDYLAPCMQPEDRFRKISQIFTPYHPGTLRALLQNLENLIEDDSDFWLQEGLSGALPIIKHCQSKIKSVSKNEQSEIDQVTGLLAHSEEQSLIKHLLEKCIQEFSDIPDLRERLILAQETKSNEIDSISADLAGKKDSSTRSLNTLKTHYFPSRP